MDRGRGSVSKGTRRRRQVSVCRVTDGEEWLEVGQDQSPGVSQLRSQTTLALA